MSSVVSIPIMFGRSRSPKDSARNSKAEPNCWGMKFLSMGLAVPDSARLSLIVTACLLLALGANSASRAQQPSPDGRYPAHWWTPIDDPKKPEWEILPQEAGPGEVILSKRNELGLLSNFAPTRLSSMERNTRVSKASGR